MLYNPYNLNGKKILITGASSGIGRATAVECSRMGAELVLTARNEQKLKETIDCLEGGEAKHIYVLADLSKEEDIAALVKECGQLDGCFCNAGISKRAPLKFYTEELFDEHYKINVLSPMLLIKALLRGKKLRDGASIVFNSSISAVGVTTNGSGMYGTSKAAINTYMRYAALELGGRNIRCNAVNPAMIETGLVNVTEEDKAKDLDNYPLRRYGEAEDVAQGVVYLLSDAAKWVTGLELKIDGGRSLK